MMDIVGKKDLPEDFAFEVEETDVDSGFSITLTARNTKLRGMGIIWLFSNKTSQ